MLTPFSSRGISTMKQQVDSVCTAISHTPRARIERVAGAGDRFFLRSSVDAGRWALGRRLRI